MAIAYVDGWWASDLEVLCGWQHNDCTNSCLKKNIIVYNEKVLVQYASIFEDIEY